LKGEVSPVSTEPPSLQELRDSVNGIFAMIRAIGADQFKQNIYVALASAVGTFSWGFGDKFAKCIQHHHVWVR
jgi:hypothetical protein